MIGIQHGRGRIAFILKQSPTQRIYMFGWRDLETQKLCLPFFKVGFSRANANFPKAQPNDFFHPVNRSRLANILFNWTDEQRTALDERIFSMNKRLLNPKRRKANP